MAEEGNVSKFVGTNIWSILTLIFVAGGAYGMLTSHEASINELEEQIAELELNKVSNSSLILKWETLHNQIETLHIQIESTNKRVRRKIDGDIKNCLIISNESKTKIEVLEAKLEQAESELDGLWKFTNKFLEKIR
jgi:hypothetical protein